MQSILSSLILAIVAGAAVDSAAILKSKSVAKRDLWHYGGTENHQDQGVQGRSMELNQHSGGGAHYGQLSSDNYKLGHLHAPVHQVHEWPQEESHDTKNSLEWKPVYSEPEKLYTVASHPQVSSNQQHAQKVWRSVDEDKHDGIHHVHHHHHHVKVIEVPKPYTVHVEKPFPVYVEKPLIVEKHVPLNYSITKKIH